MIVPYGHVLILAASIFALGLLAVLARRNLIMMLIGVEVMMNAAGVAFVGSSLRWQQLEGQSFVLFIIAVAATEVSVGLALIVALHRRARTADPDRYQELRY